MLAGVAQVKQKGHPPRAATAATDLRVRGPCCLVYNTEVYPPLRVKLEQLEQLARLKQREQSGQLNPLKQLEQLLQLGIIQSEHRPACGHPQTGRVYPE